MKKILTTLVFVMVLVCAFCVVSYAAGEFEVTYTANSNGKTSTFTVETLSGVVFQANNANAKDAKFEVKLLADVASGTGNNTAFGKNTMITGGALPSTVVFDLNGKTLTMDRYFAAKDGANLTIKNGTINYTSAADYPFIAQTGATIITEDLNIVSAAGGLSTNYSTSQTGGGNLKIYNTNITAAANTLYAMSPNAEVEVYGGNFVSTDSQGRIFKFHNANFVKIYGGTYSNTATTPTGFTTINNGNSGNGKLTIYGGTFPKPVVVECLAEGYANVDNGDGTFTVSKKPTDVTSGANVNYADGNNNYTYRFFKAIATATCEDYAKVVFEIASGEKAWKIELNEVYGKVTVNGESYAAAGAYVVTGAIGDVPTDDVEFTVNAYAVDFEGNKAELN